MVYTVVAKAEMQLETMIEASNLEEAKEKASKLDIYDFDEVGAKLKSKRIKK